MVPFKEKTFTNGLTVVTAPEKDSPSFSLLFEVLAGSRFEMKQEEGLAHFLEHLAFKGSSKFPSQLDVAKEVEGFGGSWNAGTGNETIGYYIKAAAENFDRAFNVLEDIVFHPLLEPQEIEKEKGVILEEQKLYFDDPKIWVEVKNEALIFAGHPLGFDIAGRPETVRAMKREGFEKFRQLYFAPGRFVIGAAGNFDEAKFLSLIEKTVAGLDNGKTTPLNGFTSSQNDPRFYFEPRETKQVNLMLSFLGTSLKDEDKYPAALLGFILGAGLSSRLFQEVRTKRGLAYAISAASSPLMDTGTFSIYAGVLKDKVDEALEAIVAELDRIRREPVPEDELSRNKNHLKGLKALSIEDNLGLVSFLVGQRLLTGEIMPYEAQNGLIDKVTVADIKRLANQIFTSAHANLSVIGLPADPKLKSLIESF